MILRYVLVVGIISMIFSSCSSCPEKKKEMDVLPSDIKTVKKATIERIEVLEGSVGVHDSSLHVYHYDGKTLTVYNGHHILISQEVGNAGHFRWSNDGATLYYIEYRDFIKKGSWLNAGIVKKLLIADGKSEQIGMYDNVTYFALFSDESKMALINLGSVILLTFEKKAMVERKITNGYGMSVCFAGENVAVYERRDNDTLTFVTYKGEVLSSFLINQLPNRWTSPDRMEIKDDALRVFSSDTVREFASLKKPASIQPKELQIEPAVVPNRIAVGNGHIEYIHEDGNTKFYFTTEIEREFLNTLPVSLPMQFFVRENFVYYVWPKGLVVFSYSLE